MLRFLPRMPQAPAPQALTALRPYTGVLAQLLYARGIGDAQQAERFLHPQLSHLHDPFRMTHMQETVALITAAREAKLPTVVYGDYDVDGMCAAALLSDALKAYGLDVEVYTPLREEGYGLNTGAVTRLAEKYKLLITVDLGITNHAEVLLAQELGMTVIVTDHHQLALEDSPADAVLSPLVGDYPCPRLCGTGVAFKLAQALLGLDKAQAYLDLAALATVADIVPLTDENRTLVALGLPVIASRKREGLRALLAVSNAGETIASDTLGFQLGPRLNAAGRLGDAAQGVRLLLAQDPAEADALAQSLNTLNTQRKALESDVLAQALRQAETHDFVAEKALIVMGEGWHVGVIGLAAGRLCQRYGCPTVALSQEGDTLHGSLRSVPGVNVHKCLQACDDLLLRYGGHEQAAGVTLAAENYQAFCQRFQHAVALAAADEALIPSQVYDLPLSFSDATQTLARQLLELAPFGMDNPAPLFLAENLRLERRKPCGAEGAHLQLSVRQGSTLLDGIAFGMGREASLLPDTVDAVLSLGLNTFRGVTRLQCEVKALRPAAQASRDTLLRAENEVFESALTADLLAQKSHNPKAGKNTPSAENIKVIDGAQVPLPGRGILYAARTRESALALWERFAPIGRSTVSGPAVHADYADHADHAPPIRASQPAPSLDLCWRSLRDPLCFATLLVAPGFFGLSGTWRQVILLDGEICPGEAAHWAALLPTAQVLVCPQSPFLSQLAASLDAGDPAYRTLYRALKVNAFSSLAQAAAAAGLTPGQCLTGLTAFRELDLIAFTETPFSYALLPPVPCELGQSPTLSTLRALMAPLSLCN